MHACFCIIVLCKTFLNFGKKILAKVISSYTAPRKASGMSCFMVIRLMRLERFHFSKFFLSSWELSTVREAGCSILSARPRSMQPKTIRTFSFHSLKYVPLSMRILLTFADIVAAKIIAVQRINQICMHVHIITKWMTFKFKQLQNTLQDA